MSNISDEEWDDFLEADEEPTASPFGVQNQVDPLVFIDSKEAPELRATHLPPQRNAFDTPVPAEPKPYFLDDTSDNSRAQWVPAGETLETEATPVAENATSVIRIILQALLFLAPLGVIAISFAIALNIE